MDTTSDNMLLHFRIDCVSFPFPAFKVFRDVAFFALLSKTAPGEKGVCVCVCGGGGGGGGGSFERIMRLIGGLICNSPISDCKLLV